MTDNEIVKALEGMIQFADTVDRSVLDMVDVQTLKNTLDLINRLQEKDETRHKVFETKCEELEIAKAENERLQTKIKLLTKNGITAKYPHCAFLDTGIFLSKESNGYKKWNAYVRNQAYKEFAEKVISKIAVIMKHIEQNPYDSRDETRGTICGLAHAIGQIKDLLKEMEGGASEVED